MTIRIVIADDHQVVRDSIAMVLSEEIDFQVVGTAGTGLDAIEIVEQMKPDILIIDINMPGLNGIEAAKVISHSSPQTRILCLTMHNDETHVVNALEAGCRGFINKDNSIEVLARAIRAVNRGQVFVMRSMASREVVEYLSRSQEDITYDVAN